MIDRTERIKTLEDTNTVELTELIPYLDDRLLTEELLIDLGFERFGEGIDARYRTTFPHQTLFAKMINPLMGLDSVYRWVVQIRGYERDGDSYWSTYGTVKMLLICLRGDNCGV